MNKYINGNGFLTPAGQELLTPLKEELVDLIEELGAESESEIRTVGAILSKLVGDVVSEQVRAIEPEVTIPTHFANMADDEFKAYLEFTYGPRWALASLTAEESLRLGLIIKKTMAETAKKIKEEDKLSERRFRSMRRGYID